VILFGFTSSSSAASAATVVAAWEMNESAGAHTLHDSGPDKIHGTIGSAVTTGAVVDGAVAHHRSTVDPDISPLDPERLAVVIDDDRLDPADGGHVLTVRLRTTSPFGNVVQKGQSGTVGGFFKLEINSGRVSCLHRGDLGTVSITSGRIDDGLWHSVTCRRGVDWVELAVDDAAVGRRDGPIGTTNNRSPVTIGGKGRCDQRTVGCDYFSGDLDAVRVGRFTDAVAVVEPTTTTTVAPTAAAPPPIPVALEAAPAPVVK